jgi:hypothetical protein
MKKTTLSIALFMTIGLITNAQNAINLTKGQKTHLVNKSINTVKQIAMGQEMEIKSDITIDIDVEIKETTPDILLTHTIKRYN